MQRKGDEGPPTLSDDPAPSWPSSSTSEAGSVLARYTLGPVIGRGGMGEVVSAHDEQIGRFVAIKRLRGGEPSPEQLARFMREARIQGRLEHPAIVPVHELWHDDKGRPFFVMKQLAGVTLAEVITKLVAGEDVAKYGRRALLRVFVDVCLAIEFAHTRGIVHRDLKPANIVLGDFGDVYVLDWGIARVASEIGERASFADIDTLEDAPTHTVAGAILGTPGYISPEQIRNDPDLDRRADVYSLGTILFEMLALEPLHPRGQSALATALAGVDAHPSARGRDVPPELDAICARATQVDRDQRFATARELADTVQRYLDGDRDLALRKQLAATELAAARAAILASNDAASRRAALRAAGRALALDPESREPAELVSWLMLEPPAEVPKEVDEEIAQMDLEALKTSARFGSLATLMYLLFFPLLYWIGFRSPWYLIAGPAISAAIIFAEVLIAPRNPYISGYVAITGHLLMFALFARIITPFLFGCGPAVLMVMLLSAHRQLVPTWLLAGLAALATLGPWILEQLDLLVRTTAVDGRSYIGTMAADHLQPTGAFVGLVLYVAALVALATILGASQDNERRAVRRRIQIQSWQLRQLL